VAAASPISRQRSAPAPTAQQRGLPSGRPGRSDGRSSCGRPLQRQRQRQRQLQAAHLHLPWRRSRQQPAVDVLHIAQLLLRLPLRLCRCCSCCRSCCFPCCACACCCCCCCCLLDDGQLSQRRLEVLGSCCQVLGALALQPGQPLVKRPPEAQPGSERPGQLGGQCASACGGPLALLVLRWCCCWCCRCHAAQLLQGQVQRGQAVLVLRIVGRVLQRQAEYVRVEVLLLASGRRGGAGASGRAPGCVQLVPPAGAPSSVSRSSVSAARGTAGSLCGPWQQPGAGRPARAAGWPHLCHAAVADDLAHRKARGLQRLAEA
jgi:hypothetical protein